ncbi:MULTISPECIES: putative zinc ribbon protein [Enterobacteriaceae]|nr:putative zinc ribbon protein [Klebsiella oxytoca]
MAADSSYIPARTLTPPWFEHDQASVAANTLMNCAHIDPAVKAEERSRILRSLFNKPNSTVMTLAWYCVWCGEHYSGEKLCTTCGTGIYSIEEACWQINYT